ncbi:MAG: hypothetical protein ACXWIG_16380, partial [Caldimonas sp.]
AGALPLVATAWVAGIAAATNMVTKAVMAWLAGSVPLGRRVALGYLVALAVGALAGAAWIA